MLVLLQQVPTSVPTTSGHSGVARGEAGGCWVLHPAQHARDPPVAGHDDPADHPAALVAVGVGVVAQEGLAHPLAVAVGAAALGAAVASLVPQGVELQPVLRLPGRASISRARVSVGTPGVQTGHPNMHFPTLT